MRNKKFLIKLISNKKNVKHELIKVWKIAEKSFAMKKSSWQIMISLALFQLICKKRFSSDKWSRLYVLTIFSIDFLHASLQWRKKELNLIYVDSDKAREMS